MIAADYPVAGNKDRDRIGGIGRCDCTHSLRVMDAAGKLAIRYGRSIGYFHQFFPYGALKFRTGKDNGNVEFLTVSGKYTAYRRKNRQASRPRAIDIV